MKNRFLALVLALGLCLGLAVPVSASGQDFVIENGVLTRYNGPGGDVVVPTGVTSIGDDAFSYCQGLTSVTVPSGVTSIGARAFSYCFDLTEVAIADSVTSIGNNAFDSCWELARVKLPSGLTAIERNLFASCNSLSEVAIPDSVTSIGYRAFAGCSSLTSITIPDGVTTIDRLAFDECSNLTSAALPYGLISIGDEAFRGCENLTSIAIPDSVTSIGQSTFWGCERASSLTLSQNLTTIGHSAFSGCASLTSVTIPDGVTGIETGMFSGCSSLANIYIPVSAAYVSRSAFAGCESLTDLYYGGSPAQWEGTSHLNLDDYLLENVTIHYNAQAIPAAVGGFTDVSANAYYADAVLWAVENGITSGTSATTFSPNNTCTTAQILTFLWRANGSPVVSGDNPFSDVSTGAYYYQAALWAREKGLIFGSAFNGDTPCTRAATVTYLWKLAGQPSAGASGFTDVPSSASYAQAVAWAVREGITSGTSASTFSPDNTCTRAQIVTFLYRDMA